MIRIPPPVKRALAAYAASTDATRARLARPGLGPDGRPLQAWAKRGYKAALSDAHRAWVAYCKSIGKPVSEAYMDVCLLTLRATLREPGMTHRQRFARSYAGPGLLLPPVQAAADLEAQGVVIALLTGPMLAPAARAKLTAAWRKAGLPLG